jgi:hypothetical protein
MSEETIYLNHKVKYDLEKLTSGLTPNNRGEYKVQCPECLKYLNKESFVLYITSDKSVGYCHRCKSKFFDIDRDTSDNLVSDLETPSFKFLGNDEFTLSRIDTKYYQESNEFMDNEYRYLINRNPALEKLLPYLKFKFRKNRVVMPFFWDNEVFYYQLRYTLPRTKGMASYFCAPIDNKPIWINPLNKGTDEVILTEGIFGAIGAWLKYRGKIDTISVQGSYISKYQFWMLGHKLYNKYYLYFDDDGINKNLKYEMNKYDPMIYNNIELIHSDYGDPEDDYLGHSVVH